MQERLATIISGMDVEDFEHDNLKFLSSDWHEFGLPDLVGLEGQAEYEPFTKDTDLIIVDNISTLFKSGAENRADDWQPAQDWLLRMRGQGRSVLLVHHAGKGGAQRGTSKREDILDTVIALRHSVEYSPERGAEFEIHFEKSRGITGDDVSPIAASMSIGGGVQGWSFEPLELSNRERVCALSAEGLNNAEIAEELGIHKSTVGRHLKKARGAP